MSTFFPSASATLHNTSIPAYMIAEDARLSISPRSDKASANVLNIDSFFLFVITDNALLSGYKASLYLLRNGDCVLKMPIFVQIFKLLIMNMKKILLLIFVCLFSLNGVAQKKKHLEMKAKVDSMCVVLRQHYAETETGIEFSRVIQAPDYNNKEELYNKCMELMATAYKDAKEVIQNKDKDSGLIFGKGIFVEDIYGSLFGNVVGYRECKHTIKVEVRDGRFKVTINVERIRIVDQYSDATYPIKSFYPFWKECKLKNIDNSFYTTYFVYKDAISVLDHFEEGVRKKQNNDW